MPHAIYEHPLPRAATRPTSSARGGIDVSAMLHRLESELRGAVNQPRRREILAILHRWSWDPMLSGRSRVDARTMLFAHRAAA